MQILSSLSPLFSLSPLSLLSLAPPSYFKNNNNFIFHLLLKLFSVKEGDFPGRPVSRLGPTPFSRKGVPFPARENQFPCNSHQMTDFYQSDPHPGTSPSGQNESSSKVEALFSQATSLTPSSPKLSTNTCMTPGFEPQYWEKNKKTISAKTIPQSV